MNYIFSVNERILLPLMFVFLFVAGIFISVKIRLFFLKSPKTVVSSLIDGKSKGSFRALTVALAGTLGVGNIVGVADAIYYGGSGSVMWMIICAFISMSLKYAEVVLAIKYRRSEHGGAFYYISYALNKPVIAKFFAILCILTSFTLGNMIQSRAAADSVKTAFQIPDYVFGIILFFLCGAVIIGGFRRISDFTLKLIPTLCIIYTLLCSIIIVFNIEKIPGICAVIFKNAFSFKSVSGGVLGYGMISAMKYGCMRGIISNEAGCGTAPIAHSASKTNSPAKQGCFGIFEVFVDTVVLCSLTAFVLLIYPNNSHSQMNSVISSFGCFFGGSASYIISVMIVFFAFATLVCWSFYGIESLHFLNPSQKLKKIYLFIFCVFCIIGCTVTEKIAWALSDFTVSIMTMINCVCLFLLSGKVKSETDSFLNEQSECRRARYNRKRRRSAKRI